MTLKVRWCLLIHICIHLGCFHQEPRAKIEKHDQSLGLNKVKMCTVCPSEMWLLGAYVIKYVSISHVLSARCIPSSFVQGTRIIWTFDHTQSFVKLLLANTLQLYTMWRKMAICQLEFGRHFVFVQSKLIIKCVTTL